MELLIVPPTIITEMTGVKHLEITVPEGTPEEVPQTGTYLSTAVYVDDTRETARIDYAKEKTFFNFVSAIQATLSKQQRSESAPTLWVKRKS